MIKARDKPRVLGEGNGSKIKEDQGYLDGDEASGEAQIGMEGTEGSVATREVENPESGGKEAVALLEKVRIRRGYALYSVTSSQN